MFDSPVKIVLAFLVLLAVAYGGSHYVAEVANEAINEAATKAQEIQAKREVDLNSVLKRM